MIVRSQPSVLWHCWLGGRKGIHPVKNWAVGCWHGYLSGAQLMPLPLVVSCFSKIQIGFTFLVPAHPGGPGQRAVKRVCVCVRSPEDLPGATKISPNLVPVSHNKRGNLGSEVPEIHLLTEFMVRNGCNRFLDQKYKIDAVCDWLITRSRISKTTRANSPPQNTPPKYCDQHVRVSFCLCPRACFRKYTSNL